MAVKDIPDNFKQISLQLMVKTCNFEEDQEEGKGVSGHSRKGFPNAFFIVLINSLI